MAELDLRVRERIFGELLARPGVRVGAVDGNGLFRPLPPSLPLAGLRTVGGVSSALELVAPEDIMAVIDTWQQARVHGLASVAVHPHSMPRLTCRMHFLDLTEDHGIFLSAVTDLPDDVEMVGPPHPGALRPRFGVTHKNELAVLIDADESTCRMLERPAEELIGLRSVDLVHPDDRPRAIAAWMDLMASPGQRRRVRLRQSTGSGEWRWLEITNHNLLTDPAHGYVRSELLDVSDEMAALERLQVSEQLLRRLTEVLPIGMVHVDASGRIVYRNERVEELVGRRLSLGENLIDALPPGGDLAATLAEQLRRALTDAADGDREVTLPRLDGVRRLHLTVRPLIGDQREVLGAVTCLNDVTAVARTMAELNRQASYDSLTGCLGRRVTLQRVDELVARRDRPVTALFIDLDGFKDVNDRHGHRVGDGLLRHVGACLSALTGPDDVLGRIGGDEFLLVTPGPASDAEAWAEADRVAEAIALPVLVEGLRLTARASIGVARSLDARDADDLIARADHQMYRQKARRRADHA